MAVSAKRKRCRSYCKSKPKKKRGACVKACMTRRKKRK